MPLNPQPIALVAARIETTQEELHELASRQWISTATVHGDEFISGKNEYKARFVLHLRHKLGLTNEEIEMVLDHQSPPFSLKEVGTILGREVKFP